MLYNASYLYYEGRLKSPCKVREMALLAHIEVMFS